MAEQPTIIRHILWETASEKLTRPIDEMVRPCGDSA